MSLSDIAVPAAVAAIGHISRQMNWSMPPHAHGDFHEAIYVVSGGIQVVLGGRSLVGGPGDILVYPCGVEHEEWSLGEMETLFVAWRGILPSCDPPVRRDRNGRVRMLLLWMKEAGSAGFQNDLLNLLLKEFEALAQAPLPPAVLRVQEHIQQNLSHRHTLADLADIAQMSQFHFLRVFQRATGRTPIRYLTERRVEMAGNLVLSTPLTLHQIAEAVGFANEFHFSRVFRRFAGYPPGRLRTEQKPGPAGQS
jgi:AraC-like DNA-binding protein/uncharacterized RmlC-like cupin family protein